MIAAKLSLTCFLGIMMIGAPLLATTSSYGNALAFYSGPAAPVGVAVNTSGTVYWANYNTGQILAMAKGSSSPTVLLSGLDHPSGIAVDSNGNLYYSEYPAQTVSELPKGATAPIQLFNAGNYVPFISVDSSGNIYFIAGETCNGNGPNSIKEYVRSSGETVTVLSGSGSKPWFEDAYPVLGNLYYTACGNGTVGVLDLATNSTQNLVTGLTWPSGIAVDSQGDVFYTQYSSGAYVLLKGASSPLLLSTAGGTHYGLAVDQQGDVYYTDNLGGEIWEVPATGQVQVSATSSSPFISNTGILYLSIAIVIAGIAIGVALTRRRTKPTPGPDASQLSAPLATQETSRVVEDSTRQVEESTTSNTNASNPSETRNDEEEPNENDSRPSPSGTGSMFTTKFTRPTGFVGSVPRNWIDKNLPRCPLCKSAAAWEVGMEFKFGLNRYHFKCPTCAMVLSIAVSAVSPSINPHSWILKQVSDKNLQIESVGNNVGVSEVIGRTYSLQELQQWSRVS